MKLKIFYPFCQALSLGALAGMRSTVATAVASQILMDNPSKKVEQSGLAFMQSARNNSVLKVMVIGELIMDKMPFTPDRINPLAATGRCLSGAIAGASIYKTNGEKTVRGAILGAVAAFAATFASFYLRKAIVKATGIYDPIIGAVEDVVVIGAGIAFAELALKNVAHIKE